MRQYKNHDILQWTTVFTISEQICENFVVVPVDKTATNVALICKCFYTSVINKELSLHNNDKTSSYKERKDLPYNPSLILLIFSWKLIGYVTCIGCLKCIKLSLNADLLYPLLNLQLNYCHKQLHKLVEFLRDK